MRAIEPTPRRAARPFLLHHFLEKSAALFPDKTAVVHEGARATYADVNARANRLAQALDKAGVGRGDRVVLLSENSIGYIVSYYGILKSGAVVASLNTDIRPQALAGLVQMLEPRAIIVSPRLERTVRALEEALPGNASVMVQGARGAAWPAAANPDAAATADPDIPLDPGSCAAIIFTSGSAGAPKGVMLSHANVVANTRSIIEYLGLTEDDVQMVVLPFFYVMRKSLLNTHVAVGGTVVLNNKFAYTAAVLRQMAGEKVTGFSGVPSTFAHLLFRSPLAAYRDKLPDLRYCSQAGGHMPARVKRELLKVLPGHTRLFVMYGATEAAARLAYVPPARLEAKIDSIGIPIPGVTMSVVSPEGRDLGPGQHGEIVVRGDNIMLGYYKDEDATRRVLDERGYHTGDLGYMDEEGFFYVTGRKDDQLKVSGHRVSPQEIEDAIADSGLAVESVVFGLPDPLQGQKLAGLVVPVRPAPDTVTEILRHCTATLPKFAVPGTLRLVEAIPKTANGKLDRAASAASFLEGHQA